MSDKKKSDQKKQVKNNIGYKGQVSIAIMKGKKKISSKTIKNAGTPDLHNFLAECLAGTLNIEKAPSILTLYGKPIDSNGAPAQNINAVQLATVFKTSTVPPNQSMPTSATLEFAIPYTLFIGLDQASYVLTECQLRSARNKILASASLYNTGIAAQDTYIIQTSQTQYSLVIDWTMTISETISEDPVVASDGA